MGVMGRLKRLSFILRNARRLQECEVDERLAARGRNIRSNVKTTDAAPIKELVSQAWTLGQAIELPNAFYGPTHWEGTKKFHDGPFPYYFFLAGFVRSQNCRAIFEIGTHYGGSALAMFYGIADKSAARIVTVDISDLNQALHHTLGIIKLTGDANCEAIVKNSVLRVGDEPIDLLYVDADHRFAPTITNLGIYCLLLRPRFVIIDDILLDGEMRCVWDVVSAAYGADAVNCAEVIPKIRAPNVGFALVRLQ